MKKLNWIDCEGSVSQARILFLEHTLGIQFPISYIACVSGCNLGAPKESDFKYFDQSLGREYFSGIGIFLSLNESEWSDLFQINKSPPEFFPEGLIAFAENGGGDYICFDYRQGKDNPNPSIVYWNHEADIGQDVSFIANNFEEFINMLEEPEEI